jgi:hypothetical protein
LGSISGLPGRLGFFDFFAAGEFQEVGIDFAGQPRIGIACLIAWVGWSGLPWPAARRGRCAAETGDYSRGLLYYPTGSFCPRVHQPGFFMNDKDVNDKERWRR